MKVTYQGMPHTLPPNVQQKLDAKFGKLAKLLGERGEREARVMVAQQRGMCRAEITLQFHDHQLVGNGSDADLFKALSIAIGKLETQAVKNRAKWRVTHRHKDALKNAKVEAPVKAASKTTSKATPAEPAAKKIFRTNGVGRRKPMTLDEALLEMDQDRDYLVYRDASREKQGDGLSVLVRRRDGHFDLIES